MRFLFSLLPTVADLQILLVYATVCMALEGLLPIQRRPLLRRGWKTDLFYLLVNTIPIRLGLVAMLALAAVFAQTLLPFRWRAAVVAQPYWLQVGEALLIGDFCLYWVHRVLHYYPWLWRFHAVHHAVEDLDWVAAWHTHPIDDLILMSGAAVVVALGFPLSAAVSYLALYKVVSIAVHLNLRISIGPLRWVFSSPEFHHWHHSSDVRARNINFAAAFSLWDTLFGTAFLPRGHLPESYGIDEPMPAGYLGQLWFPFRQTDSDSPVKLLPEASLPYFLFGAPDPEPE